MNALKKRPVALLIVVAIVILSTMFSVNRSLGARAAEVRDGFYSGAYYDGYVHKSISSQLDVRVESATGLLSLANNYSLSAEAAELRDCRDTLEKLCEGRSGFASIYDADAALQAAFDSLYSGMEAQGVTDADRDAAESYTTSFSGAAKVIRNAGYNDSVRAFQREVLGEFPTGILARFCFVEPPELFE